MASSGPRVEISAIVPVRNGEASLPALLRSLSRQALAPDRYEVIVVDNDSSDRTAEVAASYGARVVKEPIPNRSRARNRGVAAAASPLYAFTDADCVADPGWLDQLLSHAHLAPLIAGAVKLRTSENPNAIERFEALWRFGQEAWVKQGWAATANLLVHADAFERLGGFDPGYHHYGEDADFCLRGRNASITLGYCATAVVEHDGEHALGPFLRRAFMHGYGGNQSYYRIGEGYRAWRRPGPALRRDQALRQIGHSPESLGPQEWRRMARLARLAYAARMAGSLRAELARAR